ncbi:hypothetical protein Hanom_Chr07g00619201 [Helianthus anomalus]
MFYFRSWIDSARDVVVDLDSVFLTFDDDGAARMVEGRFLNLQPHFVAFDYWKV